MNLQSTRKNLGFLAGITALFLLGPSPLMAQRGASVSGRVVDELRNPVANVPVAILLYDVTGGGMRHEGVLPLQPEWTDVEGRFSITNIEPTSVTVRVGDRPEEMEMLSIEIGELIFYPNNHPHFGRMRFSLEPGMAIEDAVITVKTDIKPHLRARVIFADGTPVVNARIRRSLRREDLDGSGSGSSGGTVETDAEGYFEEPFRDEDDIEFYVLGIEYNGLVAKSVPFIRYEGQPQVHLLLTLNGNPMPPTASVQQPMEMGAALAKIMDPPTMWAVNPANGHAYKKIKCSSVTDAIAQAAAEKAYLIAINDEAEGAWIQEIFGGWFWMGLSDAAEDGRWAWDSGEPVTYTNWGQGGADANTEMTDYGVLEFGGHWRAMTPGSPRARHIKEAILERVTLPAKGTSEKN